jgi:hypothetical protein
MREVVGESSDSAVGSVTSVVEASRSSWLRSSTEMGLAPEGRVAVNPARVISLASPELEIGLVGAPEAADGPDRELAGTTIETVGSAGSVTEVGVEQDGE